MTRDNHHIVILGAGFAGLMAAIRLGRKRHQYPITVTLINASEEYIIRPRLHEWATNQTHERQKIADMLDGTGVHFIQAWVTELQPEQNAVLLKTDNGQTSIAYDSLIVALGSRPDTEAIEGVAEYAYVLDAHAERGAEQLRQAILGYQSKDGRVVVIGGGATGIEGAGHIKSLIPHLDVTIVSSNAFGSFKNDERVERGIKTSFAEQNIHVRECITVEEVKESQVMLSDGETISYDICLWAGGFHAPPLARKAGLTVNASNQILIDPYQHALNYPNISAVGDCAHPIEEPGNPYRMSFPVAMIMGAHAADNIIRMLSNQPEKPLSYNYYGQGIQLGINDAIGWMGYPDDEVHLAVVRGKTALAMRSTFLGLLDVIYDYEKRFGFFTWLGKNRYAKNKNQAPPSEQVVTQQST